MKILQRNDANFMDLKVGILHQKTIKQHNGKSLLSVQPPEVFLEDINHRMKSTLKPIFYLAKKPNKHTTCRTNFAKKN